MRFINLKQKPIALFMILGMSIGSLAMAGDQYDEEHQGTAPPSQQAPEGDPYEDDTHEGEGGC